MNTTVTEKFKLNELFVSPFTKKRSFDEKTLNVIMVPMEQHRKRSGVPILDQVIDILVDNNTRLDEAMTNEQMKEAFRQLAYKNGMGLSTLSQVVHALTGMFLDRLTGRWRSWLAMHLLRYTDLPVETIMHGCGFVSPTAFSRFVHTWLGAPPKTYRLTARKPGDLGKYAL